MPKISIHKPLQILSKLLLIFLLAGTALSITLVPTRAYAENYTQNNSVHAGIYLRIPFGQTKKNQDGLKYGLRLNMTREFNNSPQWKPGFQLDSRQTFNADILSLNFSENGFRDMSFAGRKAFIYQNGVLRAAEAEGKEGGTSTVVWVLATVGVVVLAGTAAFAISISKCGNGFFSEDCE